MQFSIVHGTKENRNSKFIQYKCNKQWCGLWNSNSKCTYHSYIKLLPFYQQAKNVATILYILFHFLLVVLLVVVILFRLHAVLLLLLCYFICLKHCVSVCAVSTMVMGRLCLSYAIQIHLFHFIFIEIIILI